MTSTGTASAISDPAAFEANLARSFEGEALMRERRLNGVRAVILIVLLLVAAFNRATVSSQAVFLADLAVGISGLAWCGVLHGWLARPRPGTLVHYAAVLVDLAMVVAICIGHALLGLQAAPGVVGAQYDAIFGFLVVVAATSAMRFQTSLTLFTLAASGLAVAAGFGFDAVRLGVPFSPVSFVIKLAGALAAAYIGYIVVLRSRALILERVGQELEQQRVRQAFARYVSREVADQILGAENVFASGSRRDVTILFSDIRGFTSLSEDMAPEEVVSQLNDYFEAMVEAIFRHGGTVDKYIGDGIMAIFGAPIACDNHAVRAAQTAVAMREALERLNERRAAAGLPHLKIGIGLHTGDCVIGNIGSPERLDYTAIGDVVNTASRIEGLTKEFGVDILASATTAGLLAGHAELRTLGSAQVKGKTALLEVHHVFRLIEA